MSVLEPDFLSNDWFAWVEASAKSMEEVKQRPVTISSYFDALAQLDGVRHDLIRFGGRYGATRFGGSFDLRKVMKVYMSSPEARLEINRIAAVD